VPVRADVESPPGVKGPGDFKVMQVDFQRVGEEIDARAVELRERFLD
jgi:hypothetical protein